ncbi:MAG: hypothetical protein PUP91_15425 [Rhizonema sp. PD37]|nr:hypothetical protein [Rhizonema sp. PD37]
MLGYKPQSSDTNPEIDRFLMQAFRRMPTWKKAHLTNEATKGIQQWAIIGIRNQNPNATPEEIWFQLAVRCLSKELVNRVDKINRQKKIMDAESIRLVLRVAEILETLAVDYLIGGSVASSILGEPRATLDIDIVVNLQLFHVWLLVEAMKGEFYIDENMVTEAINCCSSFNVIHLDTMIKVDIFILSQEPLAQLEMQRRQELIITQNPERSAWFASAEDIILQKLIWYRMGNQVSDRQWRDVLGVLKVQAQKLDFNYLEYWGGRLNLVDLVAQALQEAGLSENFEV